MMEFLAATLAMIAYLEIKDYRHARRLRRSQLAISQLTRRIDAARLSELPEKVAAVSEANASMQRQLDEIYSRSEFLVKEYETVLQYRNQSQMANVDFIEG